MLKTKKEETDTRVLSPIIKSAAKMHWNLLWQRGKWLFSLYSCFFFYCGYFNYSPCL